MTFTTPLPAPGIFLWPLVLLDALLGLIMSYIILTTRHHHNQHQQQQQLFPSTTTTQLYNPKSKSNSRPKKSWIVKSFCGITSLFSVVVPFIVAIVAAILLAGEVVSLRRGVTLNAGGSGEQLRMVVRMGVKSTGSSFGDGLCAVVEHRLNVIVVVEVVVGIVLWMAGVVVGIRKGSKGFGCSGMVGVRWGFVGVVCLVNAGVWVMLEGGVGGGLGVCGGVEEVRRVVTELVVFAGVCVLGCVAGLVR